MKNSENATRQNFCEYTKVYLLNQLEDYNRTINNFINI